LVQIDLPAASLPTGSFGATFDNRTMPQNSRATEDGDQVFRLRHVLSGNVSVTAAGSARVLRASGDGTWETVAAGASVALGPGDTLFLDSGEAVTYVNDDIEPVEFIAWMMNADSAGNSEAPEGWSIHNNAASHRTMIDGSERAFRLRLRQIELAPGKDLLSPPNALLFQLVFLHVNAEGTPVAPILGQLGDGGQRNAGRQAITFYELVVEPASDASPEQT
jgi:hypothetical protein